MSPLEPHLTAALRALPLVAPATPEAIDALLASADRHGLAGLFLDAMQGAGVAVPASYLAADVARACDHAAHLEMLHRVDEVLAAPAVALKGALLAERYYARPSVRATTDIDLLVAPRDVDDAAERLARIGYQASTSPREEHFRQLGHHLHLFHEHAPPLELHFHAYRGFGTILRAEPLLERSVAAAGFHRLRVLDPVDELHYLAVHAAGHRFTRLGWLHDVALVAKTLDDAHIEEAFARARANGTSRPLALALSLLGAIGAPHPPRPELRLRRQLLAAVTREPEHPLVRAATRFAYTLALCEDLARAGRYATEAVRGRYLSPAG